jgi:hypothetical protein
MKKVGKEKNIKKREIEAQRKNVLSELMNFDICLAYFFLPDMEQDDNICLPISVIRYPDNKEGFN